MFGKKDIGTRVSAANAAAREPTAKPMIAGSAAMMLKSMGVDPAQVEGVATALIEAVQGVENRLAAIEAQNSEILALLRKASDTASSDGDAS